MTPSGLYVLERREPDGRRSYWTCREGRRAGWYAGRPRQAFEADALARAVNFIIDNGLGEDFAVRPLLLPPEPPR